MKITPPILVNICKFTSIAGIIFQCFACSDINNISETRTIRSSNSCYKIPLDSALTSLKAIVKYNMPQKFSDITSDNISVSYVLFKEVFPDYETAMDVKYSPLPNDTVLYVLDFDNNEGSAILSADARIPQDVLAITETGSLLDNTHTAYVHGESDTTGFPLGFTLYDSTIDDYYVSGQPYNTTISYCYPYVVPFLLRSPLEVDYSSTRQYVEGHRVSPLLETVWHQGTPFNDQAPKKRGIRAPAGCVNIALGQIMVYHKFPHLICQGNWEINWDAANRVENINPVATQPLDNFNVAILIAEIGINTKTLYTRNWSFAFPYFAANYFEDLQYPNVTYHKEYQSTDIITMINDSCPVFIASGGNIVSGHAWVVDGYIRMDNIYTTYNNGKYHSTSIQPDYYVHCNFGWGGTSNGYYTSGIFNTSGPAYSRENYEYIDTTYNIDGYTYDRWFYTITYSKPN